jgi:hypothetical protein
MKGAEPWSVVMACCRAGGGLGGVTSAHIHVSTRCHAQAAFAWHQRVMGVLGGVGCRPAQQQHRRFDGIVATTQQCAREICSHTLS